MKRYYEINDKILMYFQNLKTNTVDQIFLTLTRLVDGESIVAFICLLYWFNKEVGTLVILSFFASGYLVQWIKVLSQIERPFIRNNEIKANTEALKTATGYSFPSGHTQTSVSIFGTLIFYYKIYIALPFVILIPISRVVLRVHNTLDVIASIIISLVCIKYVSKYDNLYLSYLFIFLSIIFLIYLIIKYLNKKIPKNETYDALKMLGGGLGFFVSVVIDTKYLQISNINISGNIAVIATCMLSIAVVYTGLNKTIFKNAFYLKVLEYFLLSITIFIICPYLIMK